MIGNPKQKRIESPSWTKAAKGQECTFNLPNICSYDNKTTVFCHAPTLLKGMGIKSDDIFGADGCSVTCHKLMDDFNLFYKAGFTKEDWLIFWMRAIHGTLRNRHKRNILVVKRGNR